MGLRAMWRSRRSRRAAIEAERRAEKLKTVTIIDRPPQGLQFHRYGKWHDIYLLTPDQLETLPEGTKLYSILGEEAIVGVDSIDDETRGGFLGYGFKAKDIGGDVGAAHAKEEADVVARLGHPIIDGPPPGMTLDPRERLGDLCLITEEQLKQVPPGTRLYSVLGEVKIVGLDTIAPSTNERGLLEYGFRVREADQSASRSSGG